MSSQSVEEPRRLDINWVQTLAGALAAVSSAVLLSTLGVAGTIIGAAAGSIVVTVGNAVYSYYLDVSKERAAAARQAALEKANQVRARSRSRTGAGTVVAHDDADSDAGSSTPQSTRPTWREAVASLRWGRVAATVAAVFALAMAAILTFEAGAGHPVSYYTGGSSADGPRTSLGGGSDAGADKPDKPTDSGESNPSPDAPNQSAAPTETAPPTSAPTTAPPEETTEPPPTTQPTTPAPTTAPPTAGSTQSPPAAVEPTEP